MDSRIVKMVLEKIADWNLDREELAELMKKLIAANGFTAAELFGEIVSAEAKPEQAEAAKAKPVTLAVRTGRSSNIRWFIKTAELAITRLKMTF